MVVQRKLEKDFQISTEEATQWMATAPFKIPREFDTIALASSFANGYSENHCKVECQIIEQPTTEVDPSVALVEEEPEEEKDRYSVPAMVLGGVLILTLLLWWFTANEQTVPPVDVTAKASITPPLTGEAGKIEGQIQSILKVPENKPLTPVMERLGQWIKKKKIQRVTRERISHVYTRRSDQILHKALKMSDNPRNSPRKVEKFLRVAIAFNPKNRKAWEKLIQHYNRIGDFSKAAATRLKMKKKLEKG